MGAFSKIAQEATEQAINFIESMARKTGRTTQEVRESIGDYPEKIAMESRDLLPRQKDSDILDVMKEAQAGKSDLVVMNPNNFRQLAANMDTKDPFIQKMISDKVQQYYDQIQEGVPLDDLPFMRQFQPLDDIVQITGHDGRHRNRALARLGETKSLVRMVPSDYNPGGKYGGIDFGSEELLRNVDPEARVFSEMSGMSTGSPNKVGTLGELMKVLSVGGIAATGALEGVGPNAQVQETTQN